MRIERQRDPLPVLRARSAVAFAPSRPHCRCYPPGGESQVKTNLFEDRRHRRNPINVLFFPNER